MTILNDASAGHWRRGRGENVMGTVIEFPADTSSRRLGMNMGTVPQGSATILILPAIRIERQTDDTNGGSGPEEGTAPGRRKRRRVRS
jgi:hypothetical protein